MASLDFMSRSSFKELDGGSTAFFPWGPFGPGYLLPGEARTTLQSRMNRAPLLGMMVALAVAVGWGLLPSAAAMLAWTVVYCVWLGGVATPLRRTDVRLSFSEASKGNEWVWWFTLLVSMALLGFVGYVTLC